MKDAPLYLDGKPERRRLFAGWTDFWFTPASPVPLSGLRVLSGLLFIAWLLPFSGHLEAFFGLHGWFDRTAYVEANALPNGPPEPFGWSLLYLVGGNSVLLTAFYWAALGIFALFALGICVRLTAVLSWVMVVSFLATPAASYDADYLVALIAFYMMMGHLLLGQWSRDLSPAERLLGSGDIGLLAWFRNSSREPAPSYSANLTLRLLQVHFAIVVVISGLHKLQSGDWWSGVAFWYPMHPPFQTTEADVLAEASAGSTDTRLFMLSLSEYLVLAWQFGFPLFAWKKSWRVLLLCGAAIGWLGCAFLYKLPLFGPVYMIGCLSFLSPEEWLGTRRFLSRMTARPATVAEKKVKFQPRMR